MSPAASPGGALPSRSELVDWPTQHLDDAAAQLRSTGAQSVTLFDEHRQSIAAPGGTTWEGDAKDAALDRVTADAAVVRRQRDVQDEAADIAENGGHDVRAAKREVLEAIAAAENDGFTVGEDLSVTDSRSYDINTIVERNRAAKEHAEDIRWYAERLVQTDAHVGERLHTKAAELDGIRFEGEGEGRDGEPTVQLVSNEFKLNPQDEDDPWAPHPDFPNRTRNGKYGKENSKDGEAAAKAALDERERKTHIPLTRQEVRATHPDVRHPDGTPQFRYYDALEPTDNPDEYLGIEAKTNPKALRRDQQTFDAAVTPERPATAVLNGREIRIVGAQTVYPPEGWKPPSVEMGPGAGASAGEATAGPVPKSAVDGGAGGFGGAQAEGTVPATPAPGNAPVAPSWGTQLTPQEMIDSGDPALRVLGEQLRAQMQQEGKVDPSGIA